MVALCACARGKAIGLSVCCRNYHWHKNCQISHSRHNMHLFVLYILCLQVHIRFLMVFQRHNLCGFLQKHFICQFDIINFANSKLLDFALASDSTTLRINSTLCITLYTVCMSVNPQRAFFRHGCKNSQSWSQPLLPHSVSLGGPPDCTHL